MNRLSIPSRCLQAAPGASPRERGVAMIMVMVALAVATIIVLTFLSGQTTSMAIAHNASRQTQARAIAEDAIDLAMEYIRATPEWRDGFAHGTWSSDQSLNGGTFRVMFEDTADTDLGDDLSEAFRVTVEARFGGVAHRASMMVTPHGTVPATHLLLVVGDSNLSAQDQAKKALFESWGYTVVTVEDTASESEYQAAATNASVAYVSEEAYSFDIASRLYGRWIGVVNEEAQMYDELGIANSRAYYTGNSINISDNTHEITAGFALGSLQIASSSTSLVAVGSNAEASGATVLATHLTSTSYPTLTVLDIGDTMIDGDPAPNRRVTLPIGGDSFDVNRLNANGQQLVRQAVDWAAAGDSSGGLEHHWPLNESSGVTTTDLVGGDDGTFTQSPALGQLGHDQTAVKLGTGLDRVTLPASVLDGRTNYSLSIWFQTTNTQDQALLSGANASNNNSNLIYLDDSAGVYYYPGDSASSRLGFTSPTLTDGQWHHLVLVRDQTAGEVTVYIDGVSLGTQSRSLSTVDIEHLVLGEEQDSVDGGYDSGQAFVGSIDDVRIFSRALSADQVVDLYEQATTEGAGPALLALYEFGEPSPVTPQLVGHWKLDENSAGNTFMEVGGEVVIEAESYATLTPGTGSAASKSWNTTSSNSPSGGTALIAEPNTGTNTGLSTTGPRLDYPITFTTPGTYRVWVRMLGPGGGDDSVHVGLDGTGLTTGGGYGLSWGDRSSFAWEDDTNGGASNISLTIPSAGTYTFNVWMREDGTLIDKIVLNTSGSQPSGSGPAESAAGGTAADEIGITDGETVSTVTAGLGGMGDGGTSFEFNGSDSYIEVPHNSAYLLDRGTVSFWFRANDLSGTQGLIAKDTTNYATGGHFRVVANGSRLEVRLQSTSSSHYVQSSSGALNAGTWHHVAVGFGPGGLRLYLDGALVDSDDYTGGLGTSSGGVGNEEPWAFGVDQWQSTSGSTQGWTFPFDGRLDDIRLYDQNFTTDQVADLYALTDPRAVAPAVVEDTSGLSPTLDLSIADPDHITWLGSGGLTIDQATSITSDSGVPRLHAALTESETLTVEAEFTPANITQDGPARIVAYSNGTSSRNFQLGQTDAKVNARLRTSLNSSGTPDLEAGDVLTAGTREHVILTYDGEELRLYRDGRLEVAESWTGDLDNWDSAFRLVMGNEIGGSRPWLGTLHRVAIWDGSVNQVQADNLFNGDPPGAPDGGDEGLEFVVEWLENP